MMRGEDEWAIPDGTGLHVFTGSVKQVPIVWAGIGMSTHLFAKGTDRVGRPPCVDPILLSKNKENKKTMYKTKKIIIKKIERIHTSWQ